LLVFGVGTGVVVVVVVVVVLGGDVAHCCWGC
jgi:hypothetical protein